MTSTMITLCDVPTTRVRDLIALPEDELLALLQEATEALRRARTLHDWLAGVIRLQRARAHTEQAELPLDPGHD